MEKAGYQFVVEADGTERVFRPDGSVAITARPSVTVTVCGATYQGWDMACDKEPGHEGQHRAYVAQHDIVVFWGPCG